MPPWWRSSGGRRLACRSDDNVRLSAHHLRWLVERADGDHAAALAHHYQGEASVAETGWYDDTDDDVAAVFDLRWRFRRTPI